MREEILIPLEDQTTTQNSDHENKSLLFDVMNEIQYLRQEMLLPSNIERQWNYDSRYTLLIQDSIYVLS